MDQLNRAQEAPELPVETINFPRTFLSLCPPSASIAYEGRKQCLLPGNKKGPWGIVHSARLQDHNSHTFWCLLEDQLHHTTHLAATKPTGLYSLKYQTPQFWELTTQITSPCLSCIQINLKQGAKCTLAVCLRGLNSGEKWKIDFTKIVTYLYPS